MRRATCLGAVLTEHPIDQAGAADDWGQAGTLVRDVLDDAARVRLVDNIVGHLLNGVSEPVLLRAFEYWRNVHENIGDSVETDVRAAQADG